MTYMPRVLHIITRSDWGGAPRIVQLLATEMNGTSVVACGPGGKLIEKLEQADIPVHIQPNLKSTPDPIADSRALIDLLSLMRDESFDLIHCHSTKAGFLGRLAANVNQIPCIFTVHGWGFYNTEYDWLSPIIVTGERLSAHFSDAVVCVSENDLRQGRQKGILSSNDGTVIHNGISPLQPNPNRSTIENELDVDPGTTVIGAIARLSEQKNPLEIIRTADQLQANGHDVTLVLIGSGPLADDCQRYAHQNNVDVRIPGFREDALDLLVDIDIFLLPSQFEGLPLTVLEAMHLGIPLAAYDVGGVSEAVVHGETGFVVPKGSFEAFVEAVEHLVVDKDLREQFGKRAKERVETHFTAKQMVKKYQVLYDQVV